jgi:hypothetical protein
LGVALRHIPCAIGGTGKVERIEHALQTPPIFAF